MNYDFDNPDMPQSRMERDLECAENNLLYSNIELGKARARAANLERLLLKQSIRLHAYQTIHNTGGHTGTFRECNADICRDHKTVLVGTQTYKEMYEYIDALVSTVDEAQS